MTTILPTLPKAIFDVSAARPFHTGKAPLYSQSQYLHPARRRSVPATKPLRDRLKAAPATAAFPLSRQSVQQEMRRRSPSPAGQGHLPAAHSRRAARPRRRPRRADRSQPAAQVARRRGQGRRQGARRAVLEETTCCTPAACPRRSAAASDLAGCTTPLGPLDALGRTGSGRARLGPPLPCRCCPRFRARRCCPEPPRPGSPARPVCLPSGLPSAPAPAPRPYPRLMPHTPCSYAAAAAEQPRSQLRRSLSAPGPPRFTPPLRRSALASDRGS